MKWRGPQTAGEFPTLGYLVAGWVQSHCVVPDGPHQGEWYVLTDEMLRFYLWHYRLRPDAEVDKDKPARAFRYRRSQLVRPQKWGKGPFAASMICAEGEGPVLFDGWAEGARRKPDVYRCEDHGCQCGWEFPFERGEPMGYSWPTPWIQVTAVNEDQTDNVWRALVPMIELGPLAEVIWDTGETRINLAGRGLIEPVTSSAAARLGQRITFAEQDETHAWIPHKGGVKLAETQRRNLAGMGGRAAEFTNAWDPTEMSVAQRTATSKATDIHRDHVLPQRSLSIRNKRDRPRIIRISYGDSWWVDQERIDAECAELVETDPAQADRFFGNRPQSGGGHAFDGDHWTKKLAKPELVVRENAGELIVVGFDGARFEDSTALIATHVALGHQWPLGIWEKAVGGDEEWEVEEHAVTAALYEACDLYRVWRVYADPPYWESTVDGWAGKLGEKRVIKWWTNRPKQMAYAVRGYANAQKASDVSHDGDVTFARHIDNARRKPHPGLRDEDGRPLWTIQKDRPGSPLKIDAAAAGTLSWKARGDAIAAGALAEEEVPTLIRY